ncbi:MAG: YegS/Rv2252/BmrU family lipid kinase [Gemmatimonadetes bacterium]|nr:YegS/Rv2252/BmrU family lipid kinase [Gemmatimonadota bacterium]
MGAKAVRVLYNPASGSGRGARAIVGIRAAFARCGFTDVRATRHAGDEARLVAEAIADGIETLVVAGGDGTWSNCAVPLARAGSPARLAILAAGTGNDFAKNLGTHPRDARTLAERLADGGVTERRVDMGRVDDIWFLNVAGMGFDVACNAAAERLRPLPVAPRYVAAALSELFRYEGLLIGVKSAPMRRRLLAVAANGAHFGGAFRIAPDARIDDAALDVVVVEDLSSLARLRVLLRALRGTHLTHSAVTHQRAARVTLTFPAPPLIEADGELRQATSATVEVASVPAALRLVAD